LIACRQIQQFLILKPNPKAMKKLVAAGCCIFFLQTFCKVSVACETAEEDRSAGRKVLIKALAVIVNTEANRKLPAKRIFTACSEPPLF
jgi:hypothetical protein